MKTNSIQHRRRSRKARWHVPTTYAAKRLAGRFNFPAATARLIAELAFPMGEARR